MFNIECTSQFKECMKNLPTGVTVIATTLNNVYHGITINSFTSVSLEPPIVLFCIKKAGMRHKILKNSQYFTVNILGAKQSEISKLFAGSDIAAWQDKFTGNEKCILHGCLAYLHSKVKKVYSSGDHDIITGQVIEMKCISDSLPLIYYNRKYCNICL